jgi:hypothetical protein
MADAQIILELQDKIKILEERLRALEKEQRLICEDILSGRSRERMQRRILDKPTEKFHEIKERLDEQIKIEI